MTEHSTYFSFQNEPIYAVLARMAARFPVTAWKPDLIEATEHLEPHVSHCRKKRRVSF